MVIDNRPGASGNIAMEAVAKAPPDGYTLGVANTGNIVINPYLMRHMPYDPLTELVPVGPIGTVPLFLVMNSDVPAATLQEFIAYAKAQPDKVSYASAGVGTTPDLAAHEFNRRAGLKLVFVPFRGTAPAVAAVLGGDVQVTFVSMGPHIEFVRQGKLRILGAATPRARALSARRAHVRRAGLSRFRDFDLVLAVRAARHAEGHRRPAQRLCARARPGCRTPGSGWKPTSSIPPIMTAPEFADLVKADAVKWERIVREAGVKID